MLDKERSFGWGRDGTAWPRGQDAQRGAKAPSGLAAVPRQEAPKYQNVE